MRLYCYFCHKSVSTEVPDETIVRALLTCPECIEAGKWRSMYQLEKDAKNANKKS